MKDKYYDSKVYTFIHNNGGWSIWIMIEIEKCPCNDKAEAPACESHNYSLFTSSFNTNVPSQTAKIYCEDNADNKKEYD